MIPEFPSDNPELWQARPHFAADAVTVTEAEPATATATESDTDTEIHVEVVDFDDADFAMAENESVPPPAAPDLFQRFVSALVGVALAAGAPPRVAAAVPGMLGAARLDLATLDDETVEALIGSSLLSRTETGTVTRSPSLVANAQAWRATLLGEETELPVTEMLDEWSAHLVATIARQPQQKEALRRELRARGIAAFGMVDALAA